MAKYHNQKYKGFDSKKEHRRYQELKLLERAGKIAFLETQVPYILIHNQRGDDGKVIERAVKYIADFRYLDTETGEEVVEDAKGFRTPDYIIKRKLMLKVHGIRIREV